MLSPINVNEFAGIIKAVSALISLKAKSPIEVNPSLKISEVRFAAPQNTPSSMEVVVVSIAMLVSALLVA